MLKLIAFDWNGTLLADTVAAIAADNDLFRELGFKKTVTLKEFQNTYAIPIKKYCLNLGMSESFFNKNSDLIDSTYLKYYEPREKLCRTRSGAKEVLQLLKRRGIKAIIFSNHTKAHIGKQLERLGMDGYFATILGREKGDNSHMLTAGKDVKLKAYVKSQKLKADEVATVGDTDEEIEIGKKYGYRTIALSGGYTSASRLKACKPDALIHNLKDIISIVKEY